MAYHVYSHLFRPRIRVRHARSHNPLILSASYFSLPLDSDLTARHQSNAIIVCALSFPLPLRLGIVHCVLWCCLYLTRVVD
jgi:hypothetical protein